MGVGTISSALYQQVMGQYNIENSASATGTSYRPLIVGSGTAAQRFTGFALAHFAATGSAWHMTAVFPSSGSMNFASDAAAATGGIPLGGLYHNAGAVRIRLT
jgi:hypothetical protein